MWRKIVASTFNRFRNTHSGNFCLYLHCYHHEYDDDDDDDVVVVGTLVIGTVVLVLFC